MHSHGKYNIAKDFLRLDFLSWVSFITSCLQQLLLEGTPRVLSFHLLQIFVGTYKSRWTKLLLVLLVLF